jgi:hypothetical protein
MLRWNEHIMNYLKIITAESIFYTMMLIGI